MPTHYVLSNDYRMLANEIQAGKEIACFVDYSFTPADKKYRDVAKAHYHKSNTSEMYSVGVRGASYITAFDRDEFIALCRQYRVEFFQSFEVENRFKDGGVRFLGDL